MANIGNTELCQNPPTISLWPVSGKCSSAYWGITARELTEQPRDADQIRVNLSNILQNLICKIASSRSSAAI